MEYHNEKINRAWQYLRSQQAKQIPLLALYGRKYKQYIANQCSALSLQHHRMQLNLFNNEVLNIVELLVELDLINHLKQCNQDYSVISQHLRHIYDEQYWYVQAFRPLKTNFPTFIYWLDYFINHEQPINNLGNIERKSRTLIAFKLAHTMYEKYFRYKLCH